MQRIKMLWQDSLDTEAFCYGEVFYAKGRQIDKNSPVKCAKIVA